LFLRLESLNYLVLKSASLEQLELFRYNSKKVFDVYISKVYSFVQDEMDFLSKLKLREY